jgi:parvulin-like peptidyl-prolyl isomerase
MESIMSYKSGRATTAVIIVLLIAGTALAQTKTIEEIVARVNADIILKSELENRKAQIRAQLAEPEPRGAGLSGTQLEQAYADQAKGALRDLIDEALLLQMAKEMGLSAQLKS